MQNWKLITAAAAFAMVGSTVVASAQQVEYVPAMKHTRGQAARNSRPLTVKPVAAPMATNPLVAPIGAVGTLVTAPLGGLSQAFGLGPVGGPSRPLPIVARYAGAGPVTDSVNQGWAQPVPLSANGPIYKLEPVANSGTVSPFTLIAAPITAATTLASAPINAAGAVVGVAPGPGPVF